MRRSGGGGPVHPGADPGEQQRCGRALGDDGFEGGDGAGWQGDHGVLVALADDGQGVVPAVLGQVGHVRTAGFADT